MTLGTSGGATVQRVEKERAREDTDSAKDISNRVKRSSSQLILFRLSPGE
jgi:hypothetical protein